MRGGIVDRDVTRRRRSRLGSGLEARSLLSLRELVLRVGGLCRQKLGRPPSRHNSLTPLK